MTRKNWEQGGSPRVGVFLNGEDLRTLTPHGEPVVDASFLILFNAHHEPAEFRLPPARFGRRWELDALDRRPGRGPRSYAAREVVCVESRSLLLLQRA